MIKKINYANKQAFQNDEDVPDNQKVLDKDMNEIKETVNSNAEELDKTQKKITTVISAPLNYKGSVEQFSDLQELEDVNNGDIYSVTNENKNYVYAVDEWTEYTPEIDFTEINTQIQNIIDTLPTTIADAILEDNKKKYPVGKIIMDAKNINPATYLNFGTWELWGQGKVPVGVNTVDIDFNEAEKTGGEKTHTLTLDEMPRHNHRVNEKNDGPGLYPNWGSESGWGATAENINGNGGQSNTAYAGNGSAHNNMPPYITCYMWKRTA